MMQSVHAEQIQPPYTPIVAEGVAGFEIVLLADNVAYLGAQPGARSQAEADLAVRELYRRLDVFDTQLESLTNTERTLLAPYLHALDSDIHQGDHPDDYYFAGLIPPDPATIDRLLDMPAGDKVEFLRKHLTVNEEHAADVEPSVNDQVGMYIEDTRRGVVEGWLSPAALQVIDTVPTARIVVGDWWSTAVKGRYGGYIQSTDTIRLRQGMGADAESRAADFRGHARETLPHELNHREYEKDPWWESHRWLGEAMAEHTSLAMEFGSPDVIDPADPRRKHDDGEQIEERALVSAMMNDLDAVLLTRAYSSGDTNSREWRELRSELQRTYGTPYVPELISKRITEYIVALKEARPDASDNARYVKALGIVKDELQNKPRLVTGVRFPWVRKGIGRLFIYN